MKKDIKNIMRVKIKTNKEWDCKNQPYITYEYTVLNCCHSFFTEDFKLRPQWPKHITLMWGWPIPLRLHSSTLQFFAVKPHKGFTTSPVWNKLPARPLVFRARWQLCTFLRWTSPSPTYSHIHVCAFACVYILYMLENSQWEQPYCIWLHQPNA